MQQKEFQKNLNWRFWSHPHASSDAQAGQSLQFAKFSSAGFKLHPVSGSIGD
jgi:hypothetical protein